MPMSAWCGTKIAARRVISMISFARAHWLVQGEAHLVVQGDSVELVFLAWRHVGEGLLRSFVVVHVVLNSALEVKGLN